MKQFFVRPEIHKFGTCAEFVKEFNVGEGDLIFTNEYILHPAFDNLIFGADVLYQERYGKGEPSDEMVEAIMADIKKPYKRIIAIGGGTVIDIAKILVLKKVTPLLDLFDKKVKPEKVSQLIIIPTTCGTGSEVTNLSILALISRNTKMGLGCEEMFADHAVLIPELLQSLPFYVFATSSIDALIHAVESSVSPRATVYSDLFAHHAIEIIIAGYKRIVKEGKQVLPELMEDFLIASNYAGIAFSNAGCGAVHALSYPIGGTHHVPHGEANYEVFTGVFKKYKELKEGGSLEILNKRLARIFDCPVENVYDELENLLNNLIPKKHLHDYGITHEELKEFAHSVMLTQTRLMNQAFIPMTEEDVLDIYESLY